jgi:hypothetical protein
MTTNHDRGEATVEGEVASRGEPPRRVQVDHPASRIISDMNEHTTQSRVRNNSHFAHAAFVATFEPNDIGHALYDQNWVNSMHEELKTLRGIRFGNWLILPQGVVDAKSALNANHTASRTKLASHAQSK